MKNEGDDEDDDDDDDDDDDIGKTAMVGTPRRYGLRRR